MPHLMHSIIKQILLVLPNNNETHASKCLRGFLDVNARCRVNRVAIFIYKDSLSTAAHFKNYKLTSFPLS